MGLIDGIKKLGGQGNQQKTDSGQASGPLKLVHIVEMKDNEAGARHDVNLAPGTKVSDLKAKLGYALNDHIIRMKNRQVLDNNTDLYSILEPEEKLIVTPDTAVGK
jgi:hypothetical protein